MQILELPDQVHFTFGPVPLLLFTQKARISQAIDPTGLHLEFLVDDLHSRRYKLVEAREYSATPAFTGTNSFLFSSPDMAPGDTCMCDTRRTLALLRGSMGDPWEKQLAYMPIERDSSPFGRRVLRIHLMPISELGDSVQREQVRSCEYG